MSVTGSAARSLAFLLAAMLSSCSNNPNKSPEIKPNGLEKFHYGSANFTFPAGVAWEVGLNGSLSITIQLSISDFHMIKRDDPVLRTPSLNRLWFTMGSGEAWNTDKLLSVWGGHDKIISKPYKFGLINLRGNGYNSSMNSILRKVFLENIFFFSAFKIRRIFLKGA